MSNERKPDRIDRYIKPFSVFALKLLIQAVYAAFVYFVVGSVKGKNGVFVILAAVLSAVFGFALFCPLHFGSLLFFTRRSFYGVSRIGGLFFFFSPDVFWRTLKNGFLLLLFRGMSFAVFFLPGISMLVLMCYNISHVASVFAFFVSFISFALFTVSGAWAFSRLSKLIYLSEYLFALCPYGSPWERMEKSAAVMKNKTSAVTALRIGNFLRVLLCLAVIPTGFVWKSCQQRKADLARDLLRRESY